MTTPVDAAMTAGRVLGDLVTVLHENVRSIAVEYDVGRSTLIEHYVVTAQARRVLGRIVSGAESRPPVRAWTLTGQYGTGKSHFALNLAHLACATLPGHATARARLHAVDPLLAARAGDAFCPLGTRGLLAVPCSGHRASLHTCVLEGLAHAQAGLRDTTGRDLELEPIDPAGDARAALRALQELRARVTEPDLGYSGILLILDEMGKPLEHTAMHPDTADIYFLQELAEFVNRSGETPVIFLGILHQGFDRYAGQTEPLAQREWAKVQGRFEDLPFQEAVSQMLRLAAAAIVHEPGAEMAVLEAETGALARASVAAGWAPALMDADDFVDCCVRAYPLHPTALATLPYLFRRLAQNERSLFNYLVAQEPFALQEMLQTRPPSAFVSVADLFDYLVANFQARLYASLRARSLTETLERLQSVADLDDLEIALLKSIGMLNWLSEVSPYKATHDALTAAFAGGHDSVHEVEAALESLRRRSLITFRQFNRTYGVWQGSDVDIETRMEEGRRRTGGAGSLAATVDHFLPPRPIVAKRHSYQTGTLRYFDVRYVDEATRDSVSLQPSTGAAGLALIALAAPGAAADAAVSWAQHGPPAGDKRVVVGVVTHTGRLTELVSELRALHWVHEQTPELASDAVARRELRARLAEVESLVRTELEQALHAHRLTSAPGSRWFAGGREVTGEAQRGPAGLLSHLCDALYPDTPRIWNEILNRRALSSQGAAARRSLIEGMIQRTVLPTLGIDGYPPERSMYETLLRAGGLHVEAEGAWRLVEPPPDDPLRLRPVWEAIAAYTFAPPPEPRPLRALYDLLSAPPFGLTEGVMPVLLCAFVTSNAREVTLYREGSLLPEPEIADWELLLRRPELFALAGCRITGPRAAVVERLARGLGTEPAALPVVRTLIGQAKSLPEHAWRTRRLAPATLALRRALEQARSPERLLFHDLPAALDLPSFADEAQDAAAIEEFFARLNAALQELSARTSATIHAARDRLLAACGLPEGDEGWARFAAQAGALAAVTTHPALGPLLRRAADGGPTRAGLESALAYVANRPPRTWTDADVDRFETQADVLGRTYREQAQSHAAGSSLSAEQARRSEEVAQRLRAWLQEQAGEEPAVVQAALRTLLDEAAGAPGWNGAAAGGVRLQGDEP